MARRWVSQFGFALVVSGAGTLAGCSSDCIDGRAPPLPLTTDAPAPPSNVVGAGVGGLWWVPLAFADGELHGSDALAALPLDVAVTTPNVVAVRVPASLAVGDSAVFAADDGATLDVSVVAGQGEPRAADADALGVVARSSTLPVGPVGFCPATPFDLPPPTTYLPALHVVVAAGVDPGSIALDVFAGDADDDDDLVADTVSVRGGFGGGLAAENGDTVSVIRVDPGTFSVRARSLFDGAVGDVVTVEVE